jgi:hypothetical protein
LPWPPQTPSGASLRLITAFAKKKKRKSCARKMFIPLETSDYRERFSKPYAFGRFAGAISTFHMETGRLLLNGWKGFWCLP